MNGIIFNIQKFCVNDGPGIRTTVFLKGCPLNCAWCHNPESQEKYPELMFYKHKCVNCGKCVQICKNNCHSIIDNMHVYNKDLCNKCFACTEACPFEALESAGKTISSDEVLEEVLKDKIFYENSGGGMTVSGGEPLFQFDFTLDLLKKAKSNGLHTTIETCGFTSGDKIKQIAEYTDLFLFDYKETNKNLHHDFTGVSNEVILSNIELLDKMGKNIILRCPIIPGYNDRPEHFDGISEIAEKFSNILHIELEPYHSLGENKYESLSRNIKKIQSPNEDDKNNWLSAISRNTNKVVKFA